MRKIVFCDLDGTLLPAETSRIPDTTLAHIKRITNKGVLFCVASGRPYSSLKRLFGECYRNIIFICLDGALIMHRDCVLYKSKIKRPERLLENSLAATLFSRTAEHGIPAETPFKNRVSALNMAGGEVYKIALLGDAAPTPETRVCYKKDGITEFVASGTDKGTAAKTVMEKFCVSIDNASALGDGDNDIPLFSAVGTAYRMEQCHPLLLDLKLPPVSSADEFLEKI